MTDPSSEGSREQWLTAVERVLRGRPFASLVSRTRGGIEIDPLYTATEAGPEPAPPGAGDLVRGIVDPARIRSGWDIRQHHQGDDPAEVRDAVIEDLERGVTSIELGAPSGGWDPAALAHALDGVHLDLAPVFLAPHASLAAALALVDLRDERGVTGEARGGIGLDPVGEWARRGAPGWSDMAEHAGFVADRLAGCPGVQGFVVDTSRYVDAGADEIQELAWGTATGVAYLRALTEAGLDPRSAASRIGFRWTATGDQFVTIAKLRAARRLWSRVLEVSGVEPAGRAQIQQAVTPVSSYSRRDPWVNLLRATTAALAAVVGGADAVTILPFDTLLGSPGRLGRRSARNTQLLLLEESRLAAIVDPAGGSWFVESLTDRVARAAWGRFRDVERAGGIVEVIRDGTLADQLDAAWAERLSALADRREHVVGANEYPASTESPAGGGEPLPGPGDHGGLPLRRPAGPFEALQDAADRSLAETGARPTVHIVAIGPRDLHSPRSTWVTNLLAVGGVAATGGESDGSESPIALEAAFAASGAAVAVIASTDELYAERGAATALALKEAGARWVVVVGDPVDDRRDLAAAGVDDFWYDGMDVLAALVRLHAELGISAG